MNAPVILPSYTRTLLDEERAESRQTTQRVLMARPSRASAGAHAHRIAWLKKLVKPAVQMIDEASRRIFAHEESEVE